MKRKDYILLGTILIAHLILLLVLKFTAWPEMSLWPYLITKGWLPYRDIAIAHTPLAIFDLAIFYKIFGAGILQLKIFTWTIILLSDALIFFVVKKLWNRRAAFLSLLFYIPWMLFYDGNGFWFDLYMGVLAFCSFYFVRSKKWTAAGIFWALAFISKQTAVWFLIPILFEIINSLQRPLKAIWLFVVGVLYVSIPFTLLLLIFNLLPSFWNWAVNFGVFILPKAQGQIQLPDLKTLAVALFPFLIFTPLFLNHKSKTCLRRQALNLLLWGVAGMLGAYPRFEYFHFQPAIPYIAIAFVLVIGSIKKKKGLLPKAFIGIYLVASLFIFIRYLTRNINKETRFYEQNVQDTILYVKYNTSPGDKIFVLNYWDNIYALTETLPSVDPWVPQLSWYMEIPGIQEKMIDDLRNNPPKLVIYNPYTQTGLSSYTPKMVYDYIMDNYKVTQNIDGVMILTRTQYASR